ncbi:hypothetical protein B0T14DRAFT_389865, partial [Immersiella caudata]
NPIRTQPWDEHWCRLVEEYSARILRRPEDRFPALAGLAAHVGLQLALDYNTPEDSHYLAGIWKDDLAMGLAWFPASSSRQSVQTGQRWPLPLRSSGGQSIGEDALLEDWLPSWSWAAHPGAVRYHYLGGITDVPELDNRMIHVRARQARQPPCFSPFQVTHQSIHHVQPNFRLGPVSGGYISVTSQMAVTRLSENYRVNPPEDTKPLPRPKLYSMYGVPPSSLLSVIFGRRRPITAEGIIFFDVDPSALPPETEIFCLRLGTGFSIFSDAGGAVDFGLALVQADNVFETDLFAAEVVTTFGLGRVFGELGLVQRPVPKLRRVGMFEVDIWNTHWTNHATEVTVLLI